MYQNLIHPLPNNRLQKRQKRSFISQATTLSWIVLGFTTLFQCILFPTIPNLICISIINLAWLLFINTTVRFETIQLYPVSTLIIVGFMLTQFFLPAVVTLIEGKPVVYNLLFPIDVFLHSFSALLVLLIIHYVHRLNQGFFLGSLRRHLFNIGLFRAPSNGQLWIMGIIGILAMFYVHVYAKTSWERTGQASDKFIEALVPFAYTPYLLLFSELYGSPKNNFKKIALPLMFITAALIINGLGRNSRSIFILGFTTTAFCYFLGLVMGTNQLPKLTKKNLALIVGLGFLILGPISDLSIAMVVARAQRDNISTVDLISETMSAYFNKAELVAYTKESSVTDSFSWNEAYVNNQFLSRFCNLKYNDLSLKDAYQLTDNDAMYEFSIGRLLTTFPTPLLTALEIDVDKNNLNNYSFGDYLYTKANGGDNSFAYFKTGHFSGSGLAAFGWWYLLILAILMIPVFILNDAFCIQTRTREQRLQIRFSVCLLLSLPGVFQTMSMESVIMPAAFLIRGWFQMLLTYLLMFYISRAVSIVIGSLSKR